MCGKDRLYTEAIHNLLPTGGYLTIGIRNTGTDFTSFTDIYLL
jgi:hypothetical protein